MTTPDRLRIAYVTHSAALSGAELFVARVTAASRRTEPVVVVGEDGPLVTLLAHQGVETIVVPLDDAVRARTSRSGTGSALRAATSALRATAALARALRAARIDVVTTHSAKAHVYAAIAARIAGLPTVAHVHDLARGPHLSRSNGIVLRTALRFLPAHRVTNSQTTKRSLGRWGSSAAVVGCPAAIGPVPAPPTDGPPVLGMFGRLAEWKGQDVAVRAFARAASALPAGTTLRIVGGALFDGDAEYARHLHELVADLGLEARVHFTGHVTDVAAQLATCSVVVHASVRPEPFGQVVVEAMAAGRAVIASSAGGPAEIIDDGRTGLLVPPGDVDALATAMRHVLAPGTARRLAAAALADADRYRPDRIAAELEDQYCAPLR